MIDYQWPSCDPLPIDPSVPPLGYEPARIRKIEAFFEERLGAHAVLTPSGRAAIGLLLRLHGINRSHVVFAPKWSSHCVWEVIGRYANPTISFSPAPDVVLAVHKWGRIERLSQAAPALVIEDSVDTVFDSPRSLFPNGGSFEILSLQKTIGSYAGGVILIRDRARAEQLRTLLGDPDGELASLQARLKHAAKRGNAGPSDRFMDWSTQEYRNTALDVNSLSDIEDKLPNHDRNRDVIKRRLASIRSEPRLAAFLSEDTGRLPPVVCIPVSTLRTESLADVMIRNVNVGGLLEAPVYQPVALLPLHFAIGDGDFDARMKAMTSALRSDL